MLGQNVCAEARKNFVCGFAGMGKRGSQTAMGAALSVRDYRGRVAGLHTFELPEAVCDGLSKTITVRLADCDGERNATNMLINRKYSGRGYGSDHKLPTSSNCVTFTATSKDATIGTLSLTVDSPDGLACDKTFKDELDAFRAIPGTKLCELTRFAFDTSKPSLNLLASLFHLIFIYGTHHYNCTDLFIEVAKRHRRFYEAMLGFKLVGTPTTNDAVGVTSHLMWLKVSDIRRLIDDPASNGAASPHSLYPYFFSKKEELGIYNRLASNVVEPQPITGGNRLGQVVEPALRFNRDRGGVPPVRARASQERQPAFA